MGNSVIYRPAYDAEVEYLESDGNSFIDTGLKASSELGILAHTQNSNGGQNWLFGGGNAYADSEYGFLANYSQSYSYFYFNDQIIGKRLLYTQQTELNGDKNVMTVGSDVYSATSTTFTSNNNVYLFARNRGGSQVSKSTGVRIYDFKIYQNSTLVRDFIPVRIGQVGYMYDKVTKQLFANKGTGNFILGNDVSNAVIPQQRCVLYFGNQRSVGFERIYEEYEWLKGDGEAYIDTEEYYRPYSDYFDLIAKDNKYPNRVFEKDEWIFGLYELNGENIVRVGTYIPAVLRIATNIVYYSSTTPNWIDYCVNEGVNSNAIHAIHISKVTGDKYLFNYNGDTFSNKVTVKEFPNNFESTVTLKLFNTGGLTNTNVFNGAINKYIHYRDNEVKCNLIPCKLLQSIPAILDGNGIARQAGECGMWDKVSNKFYGNVASSGTFTVSND